jgi:hypothetical protein
MNAREEALEHYGGQPPRCAWCGHTTDLEIDHIDGGQGQGNAHREAAWLMIRDYGRLAGLPVKAYPHMLRHAWALPWPTRAPTRDRFKTIWGTGIFSTPSDTRRPIRHGLNGCGGSQTLFCRAGSWYVRGSPPRIWTIKSAKFDFLPWHVARRMPPHVRALRRLL